MPRAIFKDGTIAKGALAVGQTLWLGGFLMTACSASAPMMTSRAIENNLHVNSELTEQLDPMELSSYEGAVTPAVGVKTGGSRVGGPELCV